MKEIDLQFQFHNINNAKVLCFLKYASLVIFML